MLFNRKKRNELDSKSKAIAVMYLNKTKSNLQKELELGLRKGETETFTANHDINCLDNAIIYLEQ